MYPFINHQLTRTSADWLIIKQLVDLLTLCELKERKLHTALKLNCIVCNLFSDKLVISLFQNCKQLIIDQCSIHVQFIKKKILISNFRMYKKRIMNPENNMNTLVVIYENSIGLLL